MRRLRLFGMASDREILMRRLQRLGCVEIDEPAGKLADPEWARLVTRPDDKALLRLRESRAGVDSALVTLQKHAPPKGGLLKSRPVITEDQLFDEAKRALALEAAAAVNDGERRLGALYAEQSKVKSQIISLAPWLVLDLPLDTPSTKDTAVLFGSIASSADRNEVEARLADATDLVKILWAGSDRETQYLVLIAHRSGEDAALDVMKNYSFSRASFHDWTGTAEENTRRLEAQLASLAKELQEVQAGIRAQAEHRADLQLCLDRLDQEVFREEAKLRLLDTRATFFLDGWAPVPELSKLDALLADFTCAWETEDPKAEEYPEVPIKLKSNWFTEPLTTITEMYSLPAYDGVDPNPLMAPFYIFFYGFMFADLAYGLILAGACAFITFKMRPKGGFGQLVRLMMMSGVMAAIIGFFTGGFFSDAIYRFTLMIGVPMPEIPFLTVNPIFDIMKDPMTVLILSLVIGMIQIIFGMGIKAYMLIRDGHFLDALFDVGSWWLLFAGVGVGAVTGFWWVAIAGIAALVLTQGREKEGNLFVKLFGGVTSLYDITGYFGDVLSYSRLMVMMLAGSVIGQVFNILGTMPGNVLVFLVVFLLGHSFNIALNVIGVYVHTSRLQYLEFFGKFYKEGGRPFKPLGFSTKYVDIKEEQ
ncbi:MAG: V-type ATP synthase subunit I [Clostridia bacterium]|nr:V-type ATP synthase subunit I [Clostridia bacterium]